MPRSRVSTTRQRDPPFPLRSIPHCILERATNSLGSAFRLHRVEFPSEHISTCRIFVASAFLLLIARSSNSGPVSCRTTCTIFRYAARAVRAPRTLRVVISPLTSNSGLAPRFFRLISASPRCGTYLSTREKPPPGGSPDLKNQSCTGCGQRPCQNHLTSADKSISMPKGDTL